MSQRQADAMSESIRVATWARLFAAAVDESRRGSPGLLDDLAGLFDSVVPFARRERLARMAVGYLAGGRD